MSIFKETFRDFVFNQLKIREAIFDVGRVNTPELGNRLLGVAKTELRVPFIQTQHQDNVL